LKEAPRVFNAIAAPVGKEMRAAMIFTRRGAAVYVRAGDGRHFLIGRKTRRPIVIGIEQITQRKRFHIHETIRRVAARVPAHYRAIFAKLNSK
jgi:hypothetical protein